MPDGSVFDATAGTWEEAHKGVQDKIEQERVDAAKKTYSDAPALSKAHMLLNDPLQQIAHGLTAGLFDKVLPSPNSDPQAAADRLGPTATGLSRAAGAVMLPSGAPAAVRAVGGGPLMRGATGVGVAAGEGGLYGGVNAATSPDTPIPAGILSGAAGGAVGQGVAQGVGSAINQAVPAIRGVSSAAPPRNITQPIPGRAPSARDLIDIAAARAEARGSKAGTAEGLQKAQRDEFAKLITGKDKGTLTKTQIERGRDIVSGDPGTRGAEVMGKYLKDKLVALGLGGATTFGTGGAVPGMLASGMSLAAGKALTVDAAKATQEAVDKLRSLTYKKRPIIPTLNAARQRTIGQGLGYGGMLGLDEFLQ